MGGLYGVDPERLDLLRRTMLDAIDELAWLHRSARQVDDRAASAVAAVIDAVRSTLTDRWLPLLDELAAWSRHANTPTRVFADVERRLPPRPRSADLLVADLQRWAVERILIVSRLLDRPDDPDLRDQLVALDGRIATHAGQLATHSARHSATTPPAIGPLLDRLDPYAAALVLGHLGLEGAELAAAAADILRRWHGGPPDGDGRLVWTDRAIHGPDTGDLIAEIVARDPSAARDLLVSTADEPAVVLESATSTAALDQLLRVGLDPHVLDTTTAARVVPAFAAATYVDATAARAAIDPRCASAREALAPALAPWLLQFGPRADDWGWSRSAADTTLRAVLADLHGWQAMRDAHWTWVERAADIAVADGADRLGELDEIAAALEQVRLDRYGIELEPARRDEWLVGHLLDAGEAVVGLAPLPGGPLLGRLSGFGIDVQRQRIEAELRAAGVVEAGADDVAARLADAADHDRAATLLAALTCTVDRLLADGRIPPRAARELVRSVQGTPPRGCAATHVRSELLGRLDRIGPALTPDTREVLTAVVLSFSADLGDRRRC